MARYGSNLRRQFLELFAEGIHGIDLPALHAAWKTQSSRTTLYRDVLGRVATAMEMKLECELLIVDFAMIGVDDLVPRVFIESENIATSAVQEVRKLCCLGAPLKVLLAVCEWDEAPEVWPHGSLRPQLVIAWRHEVALHAAAGSLIGEIVAVVAEWRNDHFLRFYSVDLHSTEGPDQVIINREVPASMA